MPGLDQLRDALRALDADGELDRHAIDRAAVAAVGVLHRELEKVRRDRAQRLLRGFEGGER